jgi:aspartate oxidase
MWREVGIERDGQGLRAAVEALCSAPMHPAAPSEAGMRQRALWTTASYIARAALLREESRGSHYRRDHPQRDDERWRQRIVWQHERYVLQPIANAA